MNLISRSFIRIPVQEGDHHAARAFAGPPSDPPVRSKVGLVWKRGRYISAGMQAFLDHCKK